jgi:hypothetical protein
MDQSAFLTTRRGVTMRPRLATPHRNARLGIATLLGILLGVALLAGFWYSGGLPSTVPGWLVGAPIVGVFVLPAALSLGLDRHLRRSGPALRWTLGVMLLVDVVLVIVMLLITASGAPANSTILIAYLLGGPFIAAAAPAFTVGGLGGYAAKWARSAVWAGILAWVGTGLVILSVACLAYFSPAPPCDSTKHLCIDLHPLIILVPLVLFAVGLVVAPLGGLAGGALRAWVGRNVRAV